jgi:hypothetical protein
MKANTKEWIQYSSAIGMLVSGVVLTFIDFFLSKTHGISDGTLWYVGQCLIYSGGIFGTNIYFTGKFGSMSNAITTNILAAVKEMIEKKDNGKDNKLV